MRKILAFLIFSMYFCKKRIIGYDRKGNKQDS